MYLYIHPPYPRTLPAPLEDFAIALAAVAVALWNEGAPFIPGLSRYHPRWANLRLEIALGALLLYCSFYFYRAARRKNSLAYSLLSLALALWAVVLVVGQIQNTFTQMFVAAGQMLLAISMVMVLYENERNAVQENALAFSTLGVDPMRLLSAEDLAPSMQSILDRLVAPLPTGTRHDLHLRAVARGVALGAVQVSRLSSAASCRSQARASTSANSPTAAEASSPSAVFRICQEPLPAFPGGRFEQFREPWRPRTSANVTAVSLQTREHNFGVLLFPHAERHLFGASNLAAADRTGPADRPDSRKLRRHA